MVSAGDNGSAVAIGNNHFGQCNIPRLDEGIKYTQISAGIGHTVLLRSDGSAVAIGANRGGQCTPRFLLAFIIQCFSVVMALLLQWDPMDLRIDFPGNPL